MCGITGWVSYNKNLVGYKRIIEDMTDTLSKRGPDSHGYYIGEEVLLGHRRLIVVDPDGGVQPMTKTVGNKRYVIVYNGELYNTEEVRKRLLVRGHSFTSYSDTEVLLTAYIEWKEKCLQYVNGIFAFCIWDEENKNIFLARDRLGVKPLFYCIKNNFLIFGSEIKALLAHPEILPKVDRNGLLEIFGLGPSRSLGSGIFKDIQEVPPACYLEYSQDDVLLREYWKLDAKPHTENFNTTVEHTKHLVVDAIERQLVSDVPVCTFLSGGLDSSAISTIAAKAFKRDGKGILNTFSIDYTDNDKYFKANDFQPNSDSYWIKEMVQFIESIHHNIVIDNDRLAHALRDSRIYH